MDKCHLKEDDLYVMGDSYNDLSMFEINKHNFVIDMGTEV